VIAAGTTLVAVDALVIAGDGPEAGQGDGP
jgi:hypothetical protein